MGLLVNRNVDSCTRTTLKLYISEFVSRYYNNLTTITSSNKYLNPLSSSNNVDDINQKYYYLLEMTNEFDLQYDIDMNGRTAAGKVRTSADNVSHKDGIEFTKDFASWVRTALINHVLILLIVAGLLIMISIVLLHSFYHLVEHPCHLAIPL